MWKEKISSIFVLYVYVTFFRENFKMFLKYSQVKKKKKKKKNTG